MIEEQLLKIFKNSLMNANTTEIKYVLTGKQEASKISKKIFYTKNLMDFIKKKEKYLQENRKHLPYEKVKELEEEIKKEKRNEKIQRKNRRLLYNRFKKILNSKKDLVINLEVFSCRADIFWSISIILCEKVEFYYRWNWCSDGYGVRSMRIERRNGEWQYYTGCSIVKKITRLTKKVDTWIDQTEDFYKME